MRALWATLVLLALMLAPVVVTVSHGPGAQAAALAATDHGHVHGIDAEGDAAQHSRAHDATDHEHQILGLLSVVTATAVESSRPVVDVAQVRADSRSPGRLERPPRWV
jgi:hypothetical protein